ncbi:MAG TPA: hypothetical protein VH021_20900, partial [Trebonia sp.]|nr:hypothetical protein [Trebonia sp.]
AARLLDSITPPDAVAAARRDIAAAFIEDLRRIDGQLRETRKKPDAAASRSSLHRSRFSASSPDRGKMVTPRSRDAAVLKRAAPDRSR